MLNSGIKDFVSFSEKVVKRAHVPGTESEQAQAWIYKAFEGFVEGLGFRV